MGTLFVSGTQTTEIAATFRFAFASAPYNHLNATKMDGHYTLTDKDVDNFEKYMSSVGVGMILRKAAKGLNQTVTISCDGDKIHIVTKSTVKSSDEVFNVGVERAVTTMDGRKVMATLNRNADGNGWTITEKWDGKNSTINMHIEGGDLVFDLECNGVKCHRVYKKD